MRGTSLASVRRPCARKSSGEGCSTGTVRMRGSTAIGATSANATRAGTSRSLLVAGTVGKGCANGAVTTDGMRGTSAAAEATSVCCGRDASIAADAVRAGFAAVAADGAGSAKALGCASTLFAPGGTPVPR
jgi:hypothetical protein